MKKIFVFSSLLLAAMVACVSCSSDDTLMNEMKEGTESVVTFRPLFPDAGNGSRKAPSKIKETTFESGDVIGVFAVDASTGSKDLKSSNYRDNVRYRFNGSSFTAVDDAITISDNNTKGLAYYAVYPYISNAGPTATFTVKSNQQSHSDYSLSDLCTAFEGPTTSQNVDLLFNHRLCNVIVELQGDNLASKSVSMKATNVQRMVQMNLNANTFVAQGNKGEVLMNNAYTNAYQCIIAPQDMTKDTQMFVATIDGKEIPLTLLSNSTFKSGCQYVYKVKVEGDKLVVISGNINPWNSDDPGTGGGGTDEQQPEMMESDPAVEVTVTSAERIGASLIIDYDIKNVSGQDIDNITFSHGGYIGRGYDDLNSQYNVNLSIGEGAYSYSQNLIKLRKGASTSCHIKFENFDATNKAKAVSYEMKITADNYTFSKNVKFYVDNIKDNRPLDNGIQTCSRKLKYALGGSSFNADGALIINFTVQNLTSDIISGFTMEGGDWDVNNNRINFTISLDGLEYSWDRKVDIAANSTINGSIKVQNPVDGAKEISLNSKCSSTSLVMEDNYVRFVRVAIK